MNSTKVKTSLRVSLAVAAFLLLCGIATAQNDQVKGRDQWTEWCHDDRSVAGRRDCDGGPDARHTGE